MSKFISKIQVNTIKSIKIYVNNYHKSLSTIKRETGADYIMNGGFFNWDWTPCPILKADGVLYANSNYGMWGYAWNTGSDVKVYNVARDTKNFIGGISLVNPWDGKNAKLYYRSEVGGRRGRTAIGMAGDNLILYCSGDGTSDAKTPEQLRDELVAYGCDSAIMYDGGGSSQCDFVGNKIYSSRIVQNLILVFTEKSTTTTPTPPTKPSDGVSATKPSNNTPKSSEVVRAAEKAIDKKYIMGLSEDGVWDKTDAIALIRCVQAAIGKDYKKKVTINGVWDAESKRVCPTLKKYNKNDVVYCLQAGLNAHGIKTDIDGSYGPATEASVKKFQKYVGLTQNGIAAISVFNHLLKTP